MTNNIFNIYFSCPVLPIVDDDVTEENIRICLEAATEIQAYLIDWEKMDGFPKMKLFTSLHSQKFIQKAYDLGCLTKKNIEYINTNVLRQCDMVVLFTDCYYHAATKAEMDCAKKYNMPLYVMPNISEYSIKSLKLAISLIIKASE